MARKTAAKPKPAELLTYVVIEPLRHDGEDYAPGDTVDLDAETFSALLAAGVVMPLEQAAA